MEISKDDVVDRVPPRFEGHADRAAYLLAEYKIPITIAAIAYLVLVATGRMGIPSLPPWWSFVFEAVAIGAIPAAIVGKVMIVDPWIPDPRHDVLILEGENGLLPRAKATPRNTWNRRHDGEFAPWQPPEGHDLDGLFDYVVTKYEYLEDVDELVVEGVNPEIGNPMDILTRNERLEEIYTDLLYQKAEFDRYKARERTRRIEYDEKNINALLAAVEHGLEFEPGTLDAIQQGDDQKLDEIDQEQSEPVDRSDEQEDRPTLNEIMGDEPSASTGSSGVPATDGGRNS